MELFHVLNRGVDKRNIFLEHGDYLRFVYSLAAFNDQKPANNTLHNFHNDLRSRYECNRDPIVSVHGWCLMKNHYHLLVSERVERGLTQFITKINVGYAKFFNKKYKRVGTLFQGRTKKIHIGRDAQFNYILHYIHLNPLDYLRGAERWRIRERCNVRSPSDALAFLAKYRWSSYLDYIGKANFPFLLTKSLFGNAFPNYRRALIKYLVSNNTEHNDLVGRY